MNAIQNKYDYNGRELVIYRERQYIDKYRCIDRERRLQSIRSFIPEGTSLLYCYMDRYNIKTIDTDFIICRHLLFWSVGCRCADAAAGAESKTCSPSCNRKF